jgi:predicted DNA-binding transcriptional regulator AlpA
MGQSSQRSVTRAAFPIVVEDNNMREILTAQEVAAMLRISTRQVYELAKETENPIPSTSERFRKSDVDGCVAGSG